MKRVHPNLSLAAALVAMALSLAGGCRNQQTAGIANPFLAPNRVTPPSTALADARPGTAVLSGRSDPRHAKWRPPTVQRRGTRGGFGARDAIRH